MISVRAALEVGVGVLSLLSCTVKHFDLGLYWAFGGPYVMQVEDKNKELITAQEALKAGHSLASERLSSFLQK